MSFEVEYRKAADIANSVNVDSKLPEKIDNLLTTTRERKPQYKWCGQHTQHLLEEHRDLEIIQSTKLFSNLTNKPHNSMK